MVSSAIPWGDTANNFLALNTIFAFKAMENELTGPVPQFLGDLPNIQGVGLGKNKLTGEIPPHIFDPPGLLGVALEGNVISGTLPSINSKSLLGLSLHSNRLVGTVPASLGENCSNLMFVDLANNQLNGTLPSSFQKLESLCEYTASSCLVQDDRNNYVFDTTNLFHVHIRLVVFNEERSER
mmetsp:Transcript_34962/g.64388  ORF Transcript_34962/g.64388 Transcript_34962/m.64388 type:complete len:182 (-) Transcript_34962:267-812(-)